MATRPMTAVLAVLLAMLFLAAFVRAEEVEAVEKEAKKSSPEKEDGAVAEKASPEKEKASPEKDKASPEKEKASPEKEKASPEKEKADEDPKPTVIKTAEDANKKKPRSLLQACKKEAKRICGDGLAVAKCLTEKSSQIEDETCKQWVDARSTCLTDAESSNKCGKKEMPRACLRKLTASDVSEKCAQSDFFKAVQMYTRWRRRHEATKAAAPLTEPAAKSD